jgi:hypothetical protein
MALPFTNYVTMGKFVSKISLMLCHNFISSHAHCVISHHHQKKDEHNIIRYFEREKREKGKGERDGIHTLLL